MKNEVINNRFREDLYYRLNVIPVTVPPLRERKEDIPLLVDHFRQKFVQRYKKQINSISPLAVDILLQYEWQGNIRELENALEYAFVRSKRTDMLCECCLPSHLSSHTSSKEQKHSKDIEEEQKIQSLIALLRQHNWNKTKVARLMGVNRSTVHRWLKNFNKSQC